MEEINNFLRQEIIYNSIRKKENKCFQEIVLNELTDSSDNVEDDNTEDDNLSDIENEIDIACDYRNNFIFPSKHPDIFQNYDDLKQVCSNINASLNEKETITIEEKLENNLNFISGIKHVDLKNFIHFNPLFVKVYHKEDKRERIEQEEEEEEDQEQQYQYYGEDDEAEQIGDADENYMEEIPYISEGASNINREESLDRRGWTSHEHSDEGISVHHAQHVRIENEEENGRENVKEKKKVNEGAEYADDEGEEESEGENEDDDDDDEKKENPESEASEKPVKEEEKEKNAMEKKRKDRKTSLEEAVSRMRNSRKRLGWIENRNTRVNLDSHADGSDDGIYSPKDLKRKKRVDSYNYISNNTNEEFQPSGNGGSLHRKGQTVSERDYKSDREIRRQRRRGRNTGRESSEGRVGERVGDSFTNAFNILLKRKDEQNSEAVEAFNSISNKRRNRNSARSNKNGTKEENKKRPLKQESDENNKGYEDIPSQYWQLIDDGIEVNLVKYALSMKLDSSEQVRESDIIGLYDIKKIIKDKIVHVILRPDLFTGLNRAAKGILLFGPPGTGKTMIAKWVASSCNCSFYNVNTSSLFSKYIGETEKIVSSLFKCAEIDSPSILFFDEIDSLLGARKKDEDDTTIRIKNQLLQMIDGINTKQDIMIVIIGATNRPDMIDDAALRRFNKRVYIPLPNFETRKEQIRYIISKHTQSGFQMTEGELNSIAAKLENWNGSDIYHLCSKCYEYVYDDAIEEYNGIQNIPSVHCFRAIKYRDFIKAISQVNTSYKNVFDYDEWSKMHSSL